MMGPLAHAKENTRTCLACNNGQNQRKLEAAVPTGCAGGNGGKRDLLVAPGEDRRASGVLTSSLSPRQCLLSAKPNSGHASRTPPLCSRFVVISQITVISLRGEFRFYLQE